jgi:Ser/Thr protein kinase RdoA (MazF antagonist)
LWSEIFGGILDGYSKTIELTKGELKAIPYMFVFIELIFTAYYANYERRKINE